MATDILTGSGTYTVLANVSSIFVECVGAGGGGGPGDAGPGEDGGGGGGGAYCARTIAVTSGDQFTYAVGAGGAGKDARSDVKGDNGGASTFVSVPLSINMSAGGGVGGQPGGGTQAGGAGGTATGGTTNTSGTAGVSGASTGAGGAGAAPLGGAGGAQEVAGTAPGGGGGGGNRNNDSAAGAAGTIRVTYTVVQPASGADDLAAAEYAWYLTRSTSTIPRAPLPELQRNYWISVVGATASGVSNQELEMKWLRSLTGVVSSQYGDMWREAVAGAGKVPQASISQNKLIYYKNVA